MYRYETHLHTWPVSKCGKATVRETLEAYKALGFAGVCITNHFINGNINIESNRSYEERIRFYFSDYEEACRIGQEIGLQVFGGVEMGHFGSDFLVYGLGKEWYLAHPEIEEMGETNMTGLLTLLMEQGALVIHAHPFRERNYIDHIRLYPRHVHGVEVYNACNVELANEMALSYANGYGLRHFAGTDNHSAGNRQIFAGMESDTPLVDEDDFIKRILANQMKPFRLELE